MADYVKKSILCQAYVHVKADLDELDLKQFTQEINEYLEARAKFFIHKGAEAEVKTKDGSLIFYASAVATGVGTIALAISKYPDFRTGVIAISGDIKRLTEGLVAECLFRSGTSHYESIRSEARLGIFGTIKNATDWMDAIRAGHGHSTPATQCKRLKQLEGRLKRIFNAIYDEEDEEYVRVELYKVATASIPPVPKARKDRRLKQEESDEYKARRLRVMQYLKPRGSR